MTRMATLMILCMALSGCVTSYHHLSDPTVGNDGYDLVCGGWKIGNQLTAKASACHNFAPYGGQFLLIDVEYNWSNE